MRGWYQDTARAGERHASVVASSRGEVEDLEKRERETRREMSIKEEKEGRFLRARARTRSVISYSSAQEEGGESGRRRVPQDSAYFQARIQEFIQMARYLHKPSSAAL